MKVKTLFGIAVIAITAYGCGGGTDSFSGGGGTPTTPIAIDATNAEDVAGSGLGLVLGSVDTVDNAAGLVLGVQGQAHKRRFNLVSFSQDQVQRILRASNGQMFIPPNTVIGVIPSPPPVPCDNTGVGSIVTSFTDVNSNSTFDSGDSVTISYSACDLGTTHLEGSMTMSSFSITGDPLTDINPWNISTDVSLNNFAVTESGLTDTINGDFTYTASTTNNVVYASTLAGTSLTDQYSGSTDTLENFSMQLTVDDSSSDYALNASGKFSSTGLGGSVTFTTPTTISGTGTANPDAGVMKFVGDNNTSVTATALSDATTVTLDIDLNGNGSTDTSITRTWTQLIG